MIYTCERCECDVSKENLFASQYHNALCEDCADQVTFYEDGYEDEYDDDPDEGSEVDYM